ncbi:Aste57867_16754 [Aphanomyces stellatus]|uniref:Aste57867_16754 protein n=2 Tax=Aphanomyces stellatus TaxID=120398 RepID=A0A485L6I0_9STRA|nr:hypothetical protein As57867_016697 [Aphanomyces stellatus]VFT93521.1 Aste57867_16754 [Aphanomyces stellatus]
MFMAAVARPRYDYTKNRMFDGKLGVWPFVESTLAIRSSKNRPKGTPITSPTTVTGDVYRDMILRNVIPAIQAKMPAIGRRETINIQQDNAGPHQQLTTDFLRAHGVERIDIVPQPAQSPDFNVLDLGLFNSIQSLQYQKRTRNIDELIGAVECALFELPVDTLAKTFVTLQNVMATSTGAITTRFHT